MNGIHAKCFELFTLQTIIQNNLSTTKYNEEEKKTNFTKYSFVAMFLCANE